MLPIIIHSFLDLFVLFSFCFLAKAQTAFYGGDFDGRGRFAGQVNGTTFIDFRIYDDFTVSAPTTVTGVFGNFLDSSSIHGAQLYWEIRSGVSEGNGGTIVVEPEKPGAVFLVRIPNE